MVWLRHTLCCWPLMTSFTSLGGVQRHMLLSKLLDRLVAQQLVNYLRQSRLLPDLQSAYRAHHSTEMPVLKVMSDIPRAAQRQSRDADAVGSVSNVRHSRPCHTTTSLAGPGLGAAVCSRFVSYVHGQTQHVRCGACHSMPTVLLCGVPQGSVLGPILFLLYMANTGSSPASTHVRRRYAGISLLSSWCYW